jgi:[ribosomal protein S18]-alanine N-acetyltransferase
MNLNATIRSATKADAHRIDQFLKSGVRYHRHLDWRKPTDWLGRSPFIIQITPNNEISAILNCVSEPEDIYWLRLFACNEPQNENTTWETLFTTAFEIIKNQSTDPVIASLSYQKWFSDLLINNGWHEQQQVVQFQWEGNQSMLFDAISPNPAIRLMAEDDINKVASIDDRCFQPIWQQSKEAIRYAFYQTGYATVYLMNNAIVGFQISTSDFDKAHLARIAVLPEYQRNHIGEQLVIDMLQFFSIKRISKITVNTQENNSNSIALYKKLNFRVINGAFPIFIYR